MLIEELENFNKKIFEEEHFTSKNRFSLQLTMGLFNGSELLFIGQNPGSHNCKQIKYDFETYQSVYEEKFHKFKLGVYLLRIIHLLKLSIKDISFINIIKYATYNNALPTMEHNQSFERILKK